jgi:hypothetical protein
MVEVEEVQLGADRCIGGSGRSEGAAAAAEVRHEAAAGVTPETGFNSQFEQNWPKKE